VAAQRSGGMRSEGMTEQGISDEDRQQGSGTEVNVKNVRLAMEKIGEGRKGGKMPVTVQIDRSKQTLTVTMPLEKARPSRSSGKTLVIASTHGCQVSDARRLGRAVVVTANAFIYSHKRDPTETRETEGSSGARKKRNAVRERKGSTTGSAAVSQAARTGQTLSSGRNERWERKEES